MNAIPVIALDLPDPMVMYTLPREEFDLWQAVRNKVQYRIHEKLHASPFSATWQNDRTHNLASRITAVTYHDIWRRFS